MKMQTICQYTKPSFYLFVCAILLFSIPSVLADVFISAKHQDIQYIGRFDFSDSSRIRFTWSGTSIKALFEGTSIGIGLEDGQGDYDIIIDGKPYPVLVTKTGESTYKLAEGLASGIHTVVISRRNENHWVCAVFTGFILDNGMQLLSPLQEPEHSIEFIGDSYTVGYGNESPSRECTDEQLRAYTNTNKSFGPIIARTFNAECFVLGWSGKGMVRNYGDTAFVSPDPYPVYYDRTLGALDEKWDFTQWIPDVVVVCLGTNDFSTTPHPEENVYKQAYHDFIERIIGNYPESYILCVATHTGPVTNYVKDIVDKEIESGNAGKVFYAEFPQNLGMSGCHWHPDLIDDSAIARALSDTIENFTDWEITSINNNKITAIVKNKLTIHCISYSKKKVQIIVPGNCLDVTIFDIKGREICCFNTVRKHKICWDISQISSGLYFIKARVANRLCSTLYLLRK